LIDHISKQHVTCYSETSTSITRKYGVVQCTTVRAYEGANLIVAFVAKSAITEINYYYYYYYYY